MKGSTTFMRSPPLLLLTYNRPDFTEKLIASLRRFQPSIIYFSSDGARTRKEQKIVNEVRSLADSIDWPCRVVKKFVSKNLGCGRCVSSAISWFFEHESEGVILEDDCLPEPGFIPYTSELLRRYRTTRSVMQISGCNFLGCLKDVSTSYIFARYAHPWGWATWRRAWRYYDFRLKAFSSKGSWPKIKAAFESKEEQDYWFSLLTQIKNGHIDTWDYQWMYAIWHQNGLAILPTMNLVKNIGIGPRATHTKEQKYFPHDRLVTNAKPCNKLKHPATIKLHQEIDRRIVTDFVLFDP